MNTELITDTLQAITDLFELNVAKLPGSKRIHDIRNYSFEKFKAIGLPGKLNEEYRYSPTEKLFNQELLMVQQPDVLTPINFDQYRKTDVNAIHIFIINGVVDFKHSDFTQLEKTCFISDLKTAWEKVPDLVEQYYNSTFDQSDDSFALLNTALASSGLFIYVSENCSIEKCIQIHNIVSTHTSQLIQLRNIIIVEKNSRVNIIEQFHTVATTVNYVTNTVSEVYLKEYAYMNYYKLQCESDKANQINTTQVVQLEQSYFNTNTVTIGGNWLRNNLTIVLKGIYCNSHLNGLQLMDKQQHIDNHTLVDHRMPHCESFQLYKGILKDKSTGVFNGKIFVRKDAQKTNAYQSSKNMLLSDDATMNTKPQLEIYADDVKCSHGSSTGQIDQNALFYLQARGVGYESAKSLLMCAFAMDVIQTIEVESYKAYLSHLIEKSFIA